MNHIDTWTVVPWQLAAQNTKTSLSAQNHGMKENLKGCFCYAGRRLGTFVATFHAIILGSSKLVSLIEAAKIEK